MRSGMAYLSRLKKCLRPFMETIGYKKRYRLHGKQIQISYCRLKQRGTEQLKVVGLAYCKEYDFTPLHPHSLGSYAEVTTDWQTGDVVDKLTPFAVMEHCQLQLTGNPVIPYLNQN
jgi:hypothetical protein